MKQALIMYQAPREVLSVTDFQSSAQHCEVDFILVPISQMKKLSPEN